MNFSRIKYQSIFGLSAFFLITTTQAGAPVLNFKLNGNPVINVDATGTTTVSYTITNNSKRPHSLALSSSPSGIVNSGGLCVVGGKTSANPNPTCTLTLTINGSSLPSNHLTWAPILCEANPNGTPNANQCFEPCHDKLDITRTTIPDFTTLSTSVPSSSILALSVNNTGLNAALTGNARYITIQNTGTNQATGLFVSATGLPTGTNITTVPTTCTGTLNPGATCTVTITPGLNATSDCNTGIAPTPGTITVSATNVALPATSDIVVLSYGCQYQGGFLYSVDDTTNNGVTGACTTTPCTKNIGGKVASLVDQAEPTIPPPNLRITRATTSIVWSSNGSDGGSVSYDIIPLIAAPPPSSNDSYSNANSTFISTYSNTNEYPFPTVSAFAICNGATQGSCNSNNILTLYDTYKTGYGASYMLSSEPTNHAYYAAGLCKATINTYTDWYLPAICELNSMYAGLSCPEGEQNMTTNLSFLMGSIAIPITSCNPPSGTNCLSGVYWSSTESSDSPLEYARVVYFSSIIGGYSLIQDKNNPAGVRCSRSLTY